MCYQIISSDLHTLFYNPIQSVLSGIVPSNTLNEINKSYSILENERLSNIGIDSLMLMEIILGLESKLNTELNYEDLNISKIDSLKKLHEFASEMESMNVQ